jgi:hypothetical protein
VAVSYIDVLSASTSSASASQDLKARLAELERDPLGIANSSSLSIDVLALDRGSLTTLGVKDRTTYYAQETIFVVLRSKGSDGLMTTRFVVWTGNEVDRRDEQRQGKVDGMSRQYKTEPVSWSHGGGRLLKRCRSTPPSTEWRKPLWAVFWAVSLSDR